MCVVSWPLVAAITEANSIQGDWTVLTPDAKFDLYSGLARIW